MARFPWHFGNTTVRNPLRLRDALLALKASALLGNLKGTDKETSFALLLYSRGVVKAAAGTSVETAQEVLPKGGHSIPLLGRKWRSALVKIGFLSGGPGESPNPYQITPNGKRLIDASVLHGQQDCFLRSLLAYRIPSPNERAERRNICSQFSPLHFILTILDKLGPHEDQKFISFLEMAAIVQTHTADEGVADVVAKILAHRQQRENHTGSLKKYGRTVLQRAVGELQRKVKADSLRDYADTNIRYLKSTGLFVSKGRGITIDVKQSKLVDLITKQIPKELDDQSYLRCLWNGAPLPTDNESEARAVVDDLILQLKRRGAKPTGRRSGKLNTADLNQLRFRCQDELLRLDETEFAQQQASMIPEIMAYLRAIHSGRAQNLGGIEILVPKDERPAYLEWAVWRAFLAIDCLKNRPWEARSFQLDNELKPVGCAPGGRADMVFEFDNHTIVVEVTLTDNSRQEAAEGEPVRRHIAMVAERTRKKTYGLFIAGNIDTNTAHTFRTGDWYKPDDSKVNLNIIPLCITDFLKLLGSTRNPQKLANGLEEFLIRCRAEANLDAPSWKLAIKRCVEKFVVTEN